jgi:hypothetical protein
MKMIYTGVAALLLVGCAADPAKVEDVADIEAARLAAPTTNLSSFAEFELLEVVYSDAIRADAGKVEEADEFSARLRAELEPIIAEWNAASIEGAGGTLLIEPRLQRLKIVSGGARFWAGAWAGDSFIDLDLVLTNKETGDVVGDVRVYRDADSMTGAWSVGKSDQNLDEYIVSIVSEYLSDHY